MHVHVASYTKTECRKCSVGDSNNHAGTVNILCYIYIYIYIYNPELHPLATKTEYRKCDA